MRCDNFLIRITLAERIVCRQSNHRDCNSSYSHTRSGGGEVAEGLHINIICEDRILIHSTEHKISDENVTACFLLIKSAQLSGLSVKITGKR